MEEYDSIISHHQAILSETTCPDVYPPRSRDVMMQGREPYLSELAISLTNKCNIQCRHCFFGCSPLRSRDLSWEVIERVINEASRLDHIRTIGFTGGEPFLNRNKLTRAVQLCTGLGIESTVISNGFWALSIGKAVEVLKELPGLRRLGLSTDSFHQEFIPIDIIRNAICASAQLGIECTIRISHLKNPVSEIERIHQQLNEVEGLYKTQYQPVQSAGRAAKTIEASSIYQYDVAKAICFTADVPLIGVDGDVAACCGPAATWGNNHLLYLGNVFKDSLGDMLRYADYNPILHALRLWGPSALYRFAQEQAEKEESELTIPSSMNSSCLLCKYMVSDPTASTLLRRSIRTANVSREIALTRLADLGETSMYLSLQSEK